jgi:hypothetical protein
MRFLVRSFGLLSLILCLAAMVLWARSYWIGDRIEWLGDTPGASSWLRQIYTCRSSAGGIQLDYIRSLGTDRRSIAMFRADAKHAPIFSHDHNPAKSAPILDMVTASDSIFRRLGFGFDSSDAGFGPPSNIWRKQLAFPYWFLITILAIPALAVARSERRRYLRGRVGICPSCGYDLRATPDRCPECGATLAKI